MSARAKFTIGAILWLAYCSTIALFIAIWLHWTPLTPPKRTEWSPEEKAWVTQRLKYHGIGGCIQDETGAYFFREGKRCQL